MRWETEPVGRMGESWLPGKVKNSSDYPFSILNVVKLTSCPPPDFLNPALSFKVARVPHWESPGKILQSALWHKGTYSSCLCSLPSQAGSENPSISLHVIGLNGPTHDLEMMPPDDPRMRFVPSLLVHIVSMAYSGSDLFYC